MSTRTCPHAHMSTQAVHYSRNLLPTRWTIHSQGLETPSPNLREGGRESGVWVPTTAHTASQPSATLGSLRAPTASRGSSRATQEVGRPFSGDASIRNSSRGRQGGAARGAHRPPLDSNTSLFSLSAGPTITRRRGPRTPGALGGEGNLGTQGLQRTLHGRTVQTESSHVRACAHSWVSPGSPDT